MAERDSAAVYMRPDELKPWARNPRKGKPVAEVAESIRRFGFAAPIVARMDGTIIAGHTRWEAARMLGLERVPVRFVDLDEQEAAALALADNRLSELAEWDDAGLSEILADLEAASVPIDGLGWDAEALRDLLGSGEPTTEPTDDAPGVDDREVHSRLGEVYELGPHRLVCGDSTNPETWAALGAGVASVVSDPPYGIGLGYSQHNDTEAALRALAAGWLPLARAAAPVVVFTPGVTRCWYYPEPDWVMCWFYGGGQHRSAWGFNSWQPILCYGPEPHLAAGAGCYPDAVNLNTPANAADIDHPCPKPIPFMRWLIERVTLHKGDIVADPFGGSGTTLLAAASLGRVARLIELDPRYCDVIRRRWTRWARENGQDPGPGALDDAEEGA